MKPTLPIALLAFAITLPSLSAQEYSLNAWGLDYQGSVSQTPPNTNFVQITGGRFWSAGLKSDGSLAAWGADWTNRSITGLPDGNDFTAVATMYWHGLALKDDGSLVTWGDPTDELVANVPSGNDYVAITGNYSAAAALKLDGSIELWGRADWPVVTDCPTDSDFASVSLGMFHGVALKTNGRLVCWGSDLDGQVSQAPTNQFFIKAVATPYGGLALKADGSVRAWGWDEFGQVSQAPTRGKNFIDIAGSNQTNYGLRDDGTITSWGSGQFGQKNAPTTHVYTHLSAASWHAIAMYDSLTGNNQPPVAVDDSIWTPTDHAVQILVLDNDYDPDGHPIQITEHSTPSSGSVAFHPDYLYYTPDNGFQGTDTFTYTIEDIYGAAAAATVTVTVSDNQAPTAVADSATTDKNTDVIVDVAANDTDPDGNIDPTTVSIQQSATHGVLTNLGDGRVLYSPELDWIGQDTFTYQIADDLGAWSNTVNVTVETTGTHNNIPQAEWDCAVLEGTADDVAVDVLANDWDPDGDALDPESVVIESQGGKGSAVVLAGGIVVYTIDPGYSDTTDTFTYSMTDIHGARSNIATVEIKIDPRNGVAGHGPSLSSGILQAGQQGVLWLDNAKPGKLVFFGASLNKQSKATAAGEYHLGANAKHIGSARANANGRAVLYFQVPSDFANAFVQFQAIGQNVKRFSNPIVVEVR